MLSGKDLGRAIEQAINKKIASGAVKSKAEIALMKKEQLWLSSYLEMLRSLVGLIMTFAPTLPQWK